MGREYVIQSWVKHEADDPRIIPDHLIDESTGYSGEQIGNRLARSNGNVKARYVRPGWLANGDADLSSAEDPSDGAKDNPLYKVDPAFRVLDEYPSKIAALDQALESKRITWTAYNMAKNVLDGKLIQAERKLAKIAAIAQEEDEETTEEEEYEEIPPLLCVDAFPDYQPTEEEKRIALENFENSL